MLEGLIDPDPHDYPARTSDAQPGNRDAIDQDADEVSLAPTLGVEQCDAAAVTIYLGTTGTRLRVPRALYDVMLAFDTPRTIGSVTQGDGRLLRAVDRLRGLGFLVSRADAAVALPARSVTDPPYRLFDCPAHKPLSSEADIVVIGVPYDGGDHEAAGARHGPIALRQTSLQLLYGLDKRTGRPLGWFDADLRRPLLRGVRIGDAGDILVTSGESQVQTYMRLRLVLNTVLEKEPRVCVLLGGDATTSFPLVKVMQERCDLSVLRIGDIEHDVAAVETNFITPATLPGSVLALPGVDRFVQIGTTRPVNTALAGFTAVTASALLESGVAAIDAHLATGRSVHLGLDLRILASSSDMPSGPARINYSDLRALLQKIGERYRIVSVDLVGLNPLDREWNAKSVAAVHLLLAMLDATIDSDGRNATV